MRGYVITRTISTAPTWPPINFFFDEEGIEGRLKYSNRSHISTNSAFFFPPFLPDLLFKRT